MNTISLVTSRCLQSQLQGLGDITACHAGAELPGDHVTGEVIQYRRQIHPAPADDLQVREVGLPHLIDGRGLVFELAGRLDDNEGRTGDQIVGLEKPVNRAFRDKIALAVGKSNGQLAWTQLRSIQGQGD